MALEEVAALDALEADIEQWTPAEDLALGRRCSRSHPADMHQQSACVCVGSSLGGAGSEHHDRRPDKPAAGRQAETRETF
jgi:hypothetical protein